MAKEPTVSPEDSFIREVDEEYRRDQLASFWTRYGRWILIVVGLLLVTLAAFLWWREEKIRERGEYSEQFSAAQQGLGLGDAKAKADIDRFASGDYGGYTALAKFTKATQATENGDNAAALAIYSDLSADTGLPQSIRDLATIRAIRLEYDALPPEKAIERLQPLAKPGAPWFGVAGEMLAIAYMRSGKPELAGPIFAAIANDDTIAPTLRQRAQQMAASLSALPVPSAAGAAPVEDSGSK